MLLRGTFDWKAHSTLCCIKCALWELIWSASRLIFLNWPFLKKIFCIIFCTICKIEPTGRLSLESNQTVISSLQRIQVASVARSFQLSSKKGPSISEIQYQLSFWYAFIIVSIQFIWSQTTEGDFLINFKYIKLHVALKRYEASIPRLGDQMQFLHFFLPFRAQRLQNSSLRWFQNWSLGFWSDFFLRHS